jgi:hypothetical protein
MTEQKRSGIIDKIKKLFALGQSSNPNESALAIAKATELMNQHGIDHGDLTNLTIDDISEIDFPLMLKSNDHSIHLSFFIGKAFNLKPVTISGRNQEGVKEKKIRFYGSVEDLSVGTFIFEYITNLAEINSKTYFESIRYKKDKWTPSEAGKKKADYKFGFVDAICIKLKEIQAENDAKNKYQQEVSNAIMVVKDSLINRYIQQNLGKVKQGKPKTLNTDVNAYNNGFEKGEKTGLHRGVGNSGESQKMIGER